MPADVLVSVLLPVWNAAPDSGRGAEGLRQTLRSLFRQQAGPGAPLPPFEIVAVDDGSTDATGTVLEALAREDARLRVQHCPHRGIVPSLHTAIHLARGRLLARMDGDDTALPQRLARQTAHLLAAGGPDLSASRVRFGGDALRAHGFAHYVDWINGLCRHEDIARNRFRDSPLCHPSVMFRREALRRFGTYADGDFAEDWELWLRWLDGGARMEKLPQTLLVWNDPPGRLTRTDGRYAHAANNRLRARWLARHLLRQGVTRVWVLGAGRVARQRLAPLWACGVEPAGFIDVDPRKIGQRLAVQVGGSLRRIPVCARQDLPADAFVLNALTAHGAPEEAARWLAAAGVESERWLLA